jgi:CRISPR/Cas system-associated exonuclease Cas4 (RecB family)
MNDSVLPATSSNPSFIPYSFRKAFGMPAIEHNDAISAYHFYRLLQRAKNIFLIYNTESQGISSAEKSRYLLQIEHELSKRIPGIQLKHRIISFPAMKEHVKEINIGKSQEIMAILEKYKIRDNTPSTYSKKLSASGIGTYINCSLQFYFRYIARLKEKEETEDYIEAAQFGKILHDTMKTLYEGPKILTKEFFSEAIRKIDDALDKAIAKEYPAWESNLEGKNLLLRNILRELIRKVLDYDKQSAPIEIKFLEADFTTPFTYNGTDAIWLYGIIDRVDKLNDTTRIIDYKTGKVEDRKPGSIEDFFADPKFKASFQTFYYGYLYNRKYAGEKITTGVYPLQKFSSGMKYYKDGEPISTEEFKAFDKSLAAIISDIFNPAITFSQTTDHERCKYCPYKQICNR